jgi:hypothetical protein
MGVSGYDKVKTRVIEGKKKCIYKKPKGNKEYVKGFGKMRSVESYIKLCKKKAASKVSKPKSKPKSTKSKKMRSRSARRYGGFLEFFSEGQGGPEEKQKSHPSGPPSAPPSTPAPQHSKFTNMASPPKTLQAFTDNLHSGGKSGGSSCGRGGSKSSSEDEKNQQGGKRKKNRTSKSSMLKMMMAAFRKKSKGKRRRGGEQQDD